MIMTPFIPLGTPGSTGLPAKTDLSKPVDIDSSPSFAAEQKIGKLSQKALANAQSSASSSSASTGKTILKKVDSEAKGLAVNVIGSDILLGKQAAFSPKQRKENLDADALILKTLSPRKPLTRLNPDSDKPVFVTPKVVFKPGEEAAIKNTCCYDIAEAAGLANSIPVSQPGQASIVVEPTKKDLVLIPFGQKPQPSAAAQVQTEDTRLLVRKSDTTPIKIVKTSSDMMGKTEITCQVFDGSTSKPRKLILEKQEDGAFVETNSEALKWTPPPREVEDASSSDDEDFESNDDEDFESIDDEGLERKDNYNSYSDNDSLKLSFSTKMKSMSALSESDSEDDELSDEEPSLTSPTSMKRSESTISEPELNLSKLHDSFRIAQEPKSKQYYIMPEGTQNMVYVRTNKGSVQYYQKDADGMVQEKIDHIAKFDKSNVDRHKGLVLTPATGNTPLDIKKNSEISAFYNRIDTNAFLECFLTIMLLRPQDGKVTDLEASNVLFQKMDPKDPDSKLRPILIDLDETLPAANAWSLHPAYNPPDDQHYSPVGMAITKVHAIRNGLMGFPQVRQPVTKEQVDAIKERIESLLKAKDDLAEKLEERAGGSEYFTETHLKALNEVIGKIDKFLTENKDAKDWTLEDLFFYTFPEYKQQWNLLDEFTKMSPTDKASIIGKSSLYFVSNEIAARDKRLGNRK